MGTKRRHTYGEVSAFGNGEQFHFVRQEVSAHGKHEQGFSSFAQQEDYCERPSSRYFVEEQRCKLKQTREARQPLVDLAEYDSFCVAPAHDSLLFHLPCENLDAQGLSAAEVVECLQLCVDASYAEEVVDVRTSSKSRSKHVCGTARMSMHDHELVSRSDQETDSCEQKLMDCKLKIMASRLKYGVDVWSLAAQLVNPYEIVPIIATRVLNRAFFKMWELMELFPGLVPPVSQKPKLLSAHLCEGPGGFVQAVHRYRVQEDGECERSLRKESSLSVPQHGLDAWFAITLASPSGQGDTLKMKVSKLQECSSESVQGHIHYGADQSGDIRNPDNISSFVHYVLQRTTSEKMHLITGDGAFDVSDDFSLQEESHSHLFLCEILTAARLQAPGGALVLKFFDCFTENTVTLLRILGSLYTTVDIVRLRTSRVCNSERFIVAQGFLCLPEFLEEKLMNIGAAWYECSRRGSPATIRVSKPCSASFLQALNQGSAVIASRQIMSILGAVDVAEDLGKRLSIINVSQHKVILSILRRKLKTVKKLQTNALSLCKSLNIPLANDMLGIDRAENFR